MAGLPNLLPSARPECAWLVGMASRSVRRVFFLRLLAIVLAIQVASGCGIFDRFFPSATAPGRGPPQVSQPAAAISAATQAGIPRGFGVLSLEIRWPTAPYQDLRGFQTQLVPTSTTQITVAVNQLGLQIATTTVVRPAGQATSSATLTVPQGNNYGVVAEAFTGATGPIARGVAAGVNVIDGQTSSVGLILLSAYTPAISAFDVGVAKVGDPLTLSGFNLTPSWVGTAFPVVKFEGTDGSTKTAAVSATGSNTVTVTVPVSAAIGNVTVTVDGATSYSSALFWVAGALTVSTPQDVWTPPPPAAVSSCSSRSTPIRQR